MIKPIISSPIVKRTILGTMMAGVVTAGAMAKPNQTENPNQIQYTEVASPSAAEGSKVLAFASNPVVNTTVRNRALDNKIISLAENAQERKENQDYLDGRYNKFGTYGATVDIQMMLDEILIDQALTKFSNAKSAELDKAAENVKKNGDADANTIIFLATLGTDVSTLTKGGIEKAKTQLDENVSIMKKHIANKYTPVRRQGYGNILAPDVLASNGKPSFETVSNTIDKNAKDLLVTKAEQDEYFAKVNKFNAEQGGSKTDEQKANLLSYKLFLLDSMVIKKVFGLSNFFKDNKEFNKFFEQEFMSKEPKKL